MFKLNWIKLKNELKNLLKESRNKNLKKDELLDINKKIKEIKHNIRHEENDLNSYLIDKNEIIKYESQFHEFIDNIEEKLLDEIKLYCLNYFELKDHNLISCLKNFYDIIIYSNFLSNSKTNISSYKKIIRIINKYDKDDKMNDKRFNMLDKIIDDEVKYKPLTEVESSISELEEILLKEIK